MVHQAVSSRGALRQDSAAVKRIRAMFPALASGQDATAFLDNAGGSQLPGAVIDALTHYLQRTYVQLGADYDQSIRATAIVAAAHRFVNVFMGAESPSGEGVPGPSGSPSRCAGLAVLGASTSQLVYTLAHAYARVWQDGDEVIVSQASHESNAGAWFNMGTPDGPRPGVRVRLWQVDPHSGRHDLRRLDELLNDRTRLVCFPHVSNILGRVEDVPGIIEHVRARTRGSGARARVLVDGVAFAPHRAMRVAHWGCDWYVYSTYKVFGPHAAALFATHDALAELTGPNHFFIPRTELPRKFELGGVSHEAASAVLALDHYLRDLCGRARLPDLSAPSALFDHAIVSEAFDRIEAMETPLHTRLLEFLAAKRGVRIIGPGPDCNDDRVGIVSFVKPGRSSADIARAGNALGLGFRFGHFYAHRLCEAMGLEPDSPTGGVVRVSFCHYNSEAELDRLIAFLDRALG